MKNSIAEPRLIVQIIMRQLRLVSRFSIASLFAGRAPRHPAATANAHPLNTRSIRIGATCAVVGLLSVAQSAWAAQHLLRDGLIMHLESSVGVHATRGTVNYWWDQSGNGQDLRSDGKIKLVNNALNGRPVLELDAARDKLRQFRPTNLPAYGNDRTVLVLSAPVNVGAKIGYGGSACGDRFQLQHDADGYSGISTGCASSIMHAQEQLAAGQWRLHTAILEGGTLFHLRDGELVDGRTRRISTGTGPFVVELTGAEDNPSSTNQRLQIAAVLVYNWALGAQDLRKVHRYLGETWLDNANAFGRPGNLNATRLPAPKMTLLKTITAKNELQLDWRVSFADECGADNGWTRSRATSGSQRIRSFNTGASYGMNCWHRSASATANFTVDLRPLRISWQPNETGTVNTGHKLFMGDRSGRYNKVIRLPKNPENTHTLQVPPGTYYVAMSALGRQGRESGLSQEIRVRVR